MSRSCNPHLGRCRGQPTYLFFSQLKLSAFRADRAGMKFHKLRLDLSRHHFYWAGGIAALVGVCMIAAMVVQASEAATLSDSAGLQSSRLHNRASGSGDSLDDTPDPGLSPVPSPASPANPTATVDAPIAVRSPAASTPVVKTPTVPKFAPVVENPADPYSRYNLVQGPDGKPQAGSGPDVRCDIWNNAPPLPVGRGQTLNIGCTVISHNGFSAPSTLTCGQPGNSAGMSTDVVPGPIPCSFNPSVVTPPPDGVARSTLTIQIPPDLPYGWYDMGFKVDSPGASLFMPPVKPLNLDVARPDFSADCGTRMTTGSRSLRGTWAGPMPSVSSSAPMLTGSTSHRKVGPSR